MATQEKLLQEINPATNKFFSPPVTPPSPPLFRSVSAPVSFSPTGQILPNNAQTPPKPPLPSALRRTLSSPVPPVSGNEESPSSKRLKRMKQSLEQMSQWCNHVISESDKEEDTPATSTVTEKVSKKGEKDEDMIEESVRIEEKPGGNKAMHFKCHCGKGYELLLAGNKCYYSLM